MAPATERADGPTPDSVASSPAIKLTLSANLDHIPLAPVQGEAAPPTTTELTGTEETAQPPVSIDADVVIEAERRYARKIARAKRRARSGTDYLLRHLCEELQDPADWWRSGYYVTCDQFWAADDRVPRIDYSAVSEQEFIERFEAPAVPVVIRGANDQWPATSTWTVERLYAQHGQRRFKVGEDDDGNPVRLKMAYFLRYALTTVDDSPLYIFDGAFGDRLATATLVDDYELPKYFRDDLFRLVGERRRPPYRWVVIGPARSGTNIHIDPLGTSAWNTLLQGHKRWVLFPPETPKTALQCPKGESEAIGWFNHVYPKTKAEDWPYAPPIDLLQHPGETVFVPGGWWHVVLNMDMTIAVTQNFCSRTNFDLVWLRTRTSRPKFALKWLARLETEYPELYRRALVLNNDPQLSAAFDIAQLNASGSSSSSSMSSSSDEDEEGSGDEKGGEPLCTCAECEDEEEADSADQLSKRPRLV